MKRDMDLVREIMLAIERFPYSGLGRGVITRYELATAEEETVTYHLALMHEAGLIVAQVFDETDEHKFRIFAQRLTWEGHDFLDTVRDPDVWKRTKDGASKMGGWTFGLIKDLATAYLKHAAKERLGLDL